MSLALKLALSPLLVAQAVATRRRAPVLPEAAGPRAGRLGRGDGGLRLLIAGDSSAAGVGVAHQDQALAGHLTRTLHRQTGRVLDWALHARSGLTTQQVHALLREASPSPADVAVVVTGVNDVIDQIPSRRAVAHREALADWLLAACGVACVLFAPLPPVHRFPLLPQPLPLGIDRVERQRALPGARHPGHDDQLVPRQREVDVAKVMLAGAADDDVGHAECLV